MFNLSIFPLQDIKESTSKKPYESFHISKFEIILNLTWNSWTLCNLDLYIPFFQTPLWKFQEKWKCMKRYSNRKCFEFTHIRYVIWRYISEIYLNMIYTYRFHMVTITWYNFLFRHLKFQSLIHLFSNSFTHKFIQQGKLSIVRMAFVCFLRYRRLDSAWRVG